MTQPNNPAGGVPDGYRLVQRLGRGAYGEVWRGEAPGGVEVALKFILRTLRPEEARRELEALQLIKGLRHYNLLSLQAFFSLPDRLVIVLELADQSLRQRLIEYQNAGWPGIQADELLGYLKGAAEALDYLHAASVQHRDIKPDNLLLLGRHAKVADCGLARMLESTSQQASTIGTPAYMAPEVWQGQVSEHSDQYSLAITYVELRLGRLPFPAGSLAHMVHCHLHAEPDLSGLGDREAQVLRYALAKTPEGRYPNCDRFVEALAQAVAADANSQAVPTAMTRQKVMSPAQGLAAVTVEPVEATPVVRPWPQSGPVSGGAQPGSGSQRLHETPGPHALMGTVRDSGLKGLPDGRNRRRWLWPVLGGVAVLLLTAVGLLVWKGPEWFGQPPAVARSGDRATTGGDRATTGGDRATTEGAQDRQPPVVPGQGEQKPEVKTALRLSPVASVTVEAGKSGALLVRIARKNCTGSVTFEVDGLPARVSAAPVTLPEDQDEARIELTAADDADEIEKGVTVRARLGKVQAEQSARVTVKATAALSLLAVRDVTLQDGQTAVVGVRVQRQRFPGRVELRLEGLPENVRSWPGTVPGGKDSGWVLVSVRGAIKHGSSKVRVTATGASLRAEGELLLTLTAARLLEVRLAEVNEAIKLAPTDPLGYVQRGDVYRENFRYDQARADYDEALRLDSNYVPAYLARGLLHSTQFRADLAIDAYSEALRLDPRDVVALDRRASAHQARFHPDRAIEDYSKAIELAPKDPYLYLDRAAPYRSRGRHDLAIAACTSALSLHPNLVAAYRTRADIHRDKGDHLRAIDDHTRVIERTPKDPFAYTARASAYRACGDYQRAIDDYTSAINLQSGNLYHHLDRGDTYRDRGDLPLALDDYTRAITLNPQSTVAYSSRANVYRTRKEYDRAIADYTRVIEITPRNAAAFLARGGVYRDRKDDERALTDFSTAISLNPRLAAGYVARAAVHQARKQYDLALADHNRIVSVTPKDPFAYINRAFVHRLLKDQDRAVEDYTQAINLNSKDRFTYVERGIAYYDKKDYDRALDDFNRAVALDKGYAAAYSWRGNAHFAKRQLDPALADYDEAIRLNPKDNYALHNRGLVYLDRGNQDRAIDDFTRALALTPRDAALYIDRGVAHYRKKDLGRAIADYTKAIELQPDYALAYSNRALAYEERGDQELARRDRERAVQLSIDRKP